ncbi:MAG: hypothetical protein L3J01_02345 [Thiomicrorhabdus sp.]|nr:hypothetical protein [Thiomicrorhabdus sp.]
MAHAVHYVSLNPVRAGLVERAEEWAWSSTKDHLSGGDGELVKVAPVLERYGDFAAFLNQADGWIENLEVLTGRQLKPRKRGPKKGEK